MLLNELYRKYLAMCRMYKYSHSIHTHQCVGVGACVVTSSHLFKHEGILDTVTGYVLRSDEAEHFEE